MAENRQYVLVRRDAAQRHQPAPGAARIVLVDGHSAPEYWYPEAGVAMSRVGLNLPKTGTTISVDSQASGGEFMQVEVKAGG